MSGLTARRKVTRVADGKAVVRPDTLAVEEPLEIRVGGEPISVTMRTPGHDIELAIGFLVSEGFARDGADVTGAIACAENTVDVQLAPDAAARVVARKFYTSSSCGICGKASVDAIRASSSYDVSGDAVRIDATVLVELPERLRAAQKVFDRTGGLHAAGLFDPTGELLCLREDVGRHNAVDKVVGWAAQQSRLPLRGCVLQVSGRASFELVQKAAMAGVPVLSAVSAPSSLAVQLADDFGLTLAGFVRGESFNLYAHPARISLGAAR